MRRFRLRPAICLAHKFPIVSNKFKSICKADSRCDLLGYFLYLSIQLFQRGQYSHCAFVRFRNDGRCVLCLLDQDLVDLLDVISATNKSSMG